MDYKAGALFLRKVVSVLRKTLRNMFPDIYVITETFHSIINMKYESFNFIEYIPNIFCLNIKNNRITTTRINPSHAENYTL